MLDDELDAVQAGLSEFSHAAFKTRSTSLAAALATTADVLTTLAGGKINAA